LKGKQTSTVERKEKKGKQFFKALPVTKKGGWMATSQILFETL